MSDLTDRQRALLQFAATQRLDDDRAQAREVFAAFRLSWAAYKSELSAAAMHPDGMRYFREAARQGSEDRRMPDHLREVLLFEVSWRPGRGGSKADAIRDRFNLAPSTYWARLAEAVEHPAAMTIAPSVVQARKPADRDRASGA